MARKKTDNWYLGAITNWDAREITIDFSFLEKGKTFEAEFFKDGINADKAAVDYKKEKVSVDATTKMTFHLANGGGLSAIIEPKKLDKAIDKKGEGFDFSPFFIILKSLQSSLTPLERNPDFANCQCYYSIDQPNSHQSTPK